MASEIRVNSFENLSGLGTVRVTDTGPVITGFVTATSYDGDSATFTILNAGANTALHVDGGAPALSLHVEHDGVVSAATTISASKVTVGVSTLTTNNLTVGLTTITSDSLQVDGTQYPSVGPLSNRNLIINGAMRIAQRSTSNVAVSDGSNEGYQTLDRFKFIFGGSADGGATISQSSVVPSGQGFSNSYHVDVTSTNTPSGSENIFIEYLVEAQDLKNSGWEFDSSSSNITISFWAQSSKAGTYVLYLDLDDTSTNEFYRHEYTLAANTWKRVVATIPGHSNAVINTDNGIGLRIEWVLASNETSGNAGAWSDTADRATSNQVNLFDNTSGSFRLTGVQLEVGDKATPFEHRSYGDELAKCQRYFQKSGNIGMSNEWFPGVAAEAANGRFVVTALDGLNDRAAPQLRFPVTMRTSPDIVYYPGRSAVLNTAGSITIYNGDTLVTTTGKPTGGPQGLQGYFQGTSTDSRAYSFQFTADAEL
tara:strand:- start:308 stop:1750 length:1443 start_codon:yes stop_codon:yes gene_type:complete